MSKMILVTALVLASNFAEAATLRLWNAFGTVYAATPEYFAVGESYPVVPGSPAAGNFLTSIQPNEGYECDANFSFVNNTYYLFDPGTCTKL